MRSARGTGWCVFALSLLWSWASIAQTPGTPSAAASPPAAPAAETPAPPPAEPLTASQEALSLRFRRFERTLLEMAEYLRQREPERAELLIRVIGKSKEDRVAVQLEQLVALLKEDRLGEAIERQGDVVNQIQSLLDLLTSEDRAKALAEEKARLERHLKDLGRIIGAQKDVRAATQRGAAAEQLESRQTDVARKTGELEARLAEEERQAAEQAGTPEASPQAEPKSPGAESKPGESKPGESKPGEPKPGESKPGESKPGESKPGESKPGESKPGESKPGESKPGESKPGESKPGESPQSPESQKSPSPPGPSESAPQDRPPGQPSPQKQAGREELEEARKDMEAALEQIRQNALKPAGIKQEQALQELEKAKEKLEEILRQLREEERVRRLQALEARLQRLLDGEQTIFNETVQLDKVPPTERQSRHTNKAVQLSRQQEELALDAQKVLALLREEGSAVAFGEAVEQVYRDMRWVAVGLARVDVGELMQSVEADIIEGLREMLDALKKELEKQKSQAQAPPPGQPNQPGGEREQALVDTLSELKMLRSLQLRINGRTQRLGRLVEGEQASQSEIVQQLQDLSQRQARIQKATYDLAVGRNR